MVAKRAGLTLAVVAALAIASQPVPAGAQHRGGGRSGGGHPGRGHAVPRGGPGYSPRGVAEARHPRAGTGTGGYYGRYHYGGRYRPYPGGYYGYYRPYGYGSFYFGWPFYYSGWWPYGWAGNDYPVYSAPYYGGGYDARMAPPADTGGQYDESGPPEELDRPYGAAPDSSDLRGRLRLQVTPADASIYVDDEFWGSARETRFLTLRAGRHSIEVVRPGFVTARREVEVLRGETIDLRLELERP